MLLLFLTNLALTADNPKKPYAVSNRNPEVSGVGAIPACEADLFIRTPCYDFFWTAANDPGGIIEVGALHGGVAAAPFRAGRQDSDSMTCREAGRGQAGLQEAALRALPAGRRC